MMVCLCCALDIALAVTVTVAVAVGLSCGSVIVTPIKKCFPLGIARNPPFSLIFALREVNNRLQISFVLPF